MAATIYAQLRKLNSRERHYLATHPHHVYAITQAFIKAVEEEKRRFGRHGWNDAADAFRHCFWSALLARDIGYFNALLFTNAHEADSDDPPSERDMDLHNNRVGLLLGKAGRSDHAIALACVSALSGGQLKVLVRVAV